MSSSTPDKVVVGCGECGAQLRLDAKYQGKKIKCPKCAGVVDVPAARPAAAPGAGAAGAGARPGGGAGGRAGKPLPPEANRPMLNRAPTVADNDPFARQVAPTSRGAVPAAPAAAERSGRGGSGGSGAGKAGRGRSATSAGGGTGRADRRGGSRQTPADRRGGYGAPSARGRTRAVPAGGGKNSLNLMIAIGGGALTLVIVALLVMMAPQDPGQQSPTAENPTPDGEGAASSLTPTERFREAWGNAGSDLERRMQTLASFAEESRSDANLREIWERYFTDVRGELGSKYGDESATVNSRVDGWIHVLDWMEKMEEEEAAIRVAESILELDSNNEKARRKLGWQRWSIPTDDPLVERARMRGSWLQDFEERDGQWVQQAEFEEWNAEFEQALTEVRALFEEWERDPFAERAYQKMQSLTNDLVLRRFADRFQLHVIKPFVVIFGTESILAEDLIDERVDKFQQVLYPFWEMWSEIVRRNNHQSKMSGDSLELPQPFAWLSMATQEGFAEYMEATNESVPSFARAFYKPSTECVYFWEGSDREIELDVVLHETVHQVQERYTTGTDEGLHGFKNLAIVEGMAEYYSGHDFEGPGGSIRFGRWNQKDRIAMLEEFRGLLNRNLGIFNWNITNDDWVLFQVPALVTQWQSMVLAWSPTHVNQQLSSSPYRFGLRGTAVFGAMYAFGWAWVYFLNERYPEEYHRYLQALMNDGKRGTEAFLDAFGISYERRDLPDIHRIIGVNEREAWTRRRQQVETAYWDIINWLKRNPRVRQINQEFVDFLKNQVAETRDEQNDEVELEEDQHGAWRLDMPWRRDPRQAVGEPANSGHHERLRQWRRWPGLQWPPVTR